ncbi:ATP-binding protein [Rhizobium sp.]|uniref:sensor histidine kinase n=1 Tax=Rhizobium sp. TaxID=391 RepID=UPI002AA8734F
MYFARPIEWVRQSRFRYVVVLVSAITVTMVLSFCFAYFQTTGRALINQLDELVLQEATVINEGAQLGRMDAYEERVRQDPRRVKPTGIFSADGHRVSGNVQQFPSGLALDMPPRQVSIVRTDQTPPRQQRARAVARHLPDGNILFVGWSTADNEQAASMVERGLLFGLVPVLTLGLTAAVFFGLNAQRRVNEMQIRIAQIVAGDLKQRLPYRNARDPLDNLAQIVNGMLDEMQTFIEDLAAVGDDIAHDLRTPLARVRIGLERARRNADSLEDLQGATDRAISGIDHAISIVTAILRIREIEQTRRLQAFDEVELAGLVQEVGDLYEPIAEEKQLTLTVRANVNVLVYGDRDLIFEAVANLVDNAVKFTPEGGKIDVDLVVEDERKVLRVSDTGPGVEESERNLLVQRFYRSDRSRHTRGLGLGLTLVAAITKLHSFRFDVLPTEGFTAEITFPQRPHD